MVIKKICKFLLPTLFVFQSLSATPLAEQFHQSGYAEISNKKASIETYNALYGHFDALIKFLQANPMWTQKLYIAKERFIRSKSRNYYSCDIFGFYDESKKENRSQISFYYSTHFHEFICSHYPEFNQISEIIAFLEACREIQTPCQELFNEAATELGLETIFSSNDNRPPILLKVVKYFPAYSPSKPHYDGSVFSLLLDSSDNQSLLFSPYKPLLSVDDFSIPQRQFPLQNSILLIPGTQLLEFSIFPTPHIVIQSGRVRYATIAFAMRSNYVSEKNELSILPNFKY